MNENEIIEFNSFIIICLTLLGLIFGSIIGIQIAGCLSSLFENLRTPIRRKLFDFRIHREKRAEEKRYKNLRNSQIMARKRK